MISPNHARSHLPHNFWSSYQNIIHFHKWRFLCSLSGHKDPPITLTIECRFVNLFEHILQPIYMSFWCPFLDPLLTTDHSNIGVQIIAMMELGTSILPHIIYSQKPICAISTINTSSTWFGTTGGLRGGLELLATTRCRRCCCCMSSNCFNCIAKLMPVGPLLISVLFSVSSVPWRASDEPVGMDGIWDSIWLYAPPEAEAVLRIALSPGNSLVLDVASGCMCKKLCVGTVFSLVRRILNAELCWNQNDHQEIHLPVILITCQLPTTPKEGNIQILKLCKKTRKLHNQMYIIEKWPTCATNRKWAYNWSFRSFTVTILHKGVTYHAQNILNIHIILDKSCEQILRPNKMWSFRRVGCFSF